MRRSRFQIRCYSITKICFICGFILLSLAILCAAQQRRRLTSLKVVQLPEPKLAGSISFEQALVKQRTAGQAGEQTLKFTQIGQLAWAGLGVVESTTATSMQLQTDVGAGLAEEVSPVRLYFATDQGVYLYNPDNHTLEQVKNDDVRATLTTPGLNQQSVAVPGCEVIITGDLRSLTSRYANDARRIVYLQAGQVAQNIQLQAMSLDLGFVPFLNFDVRNVRRVCNIPRNLEPLYIISIGYGTAQAQSTGQEQGTAASKKVVLITARVDFRDEELFETKRVLDSAGFQTTIASSVVGPIRGILGGLAEATLLITQLNVDDYDGVVFIGGSGAAEYYVNPIALNIARETVRKGKILGAICIAPAVLANAGVLTGIRATCFPSERVRLVQAGAVYTGSVVERDRNIITGNGPAAAVQFGKAIADALTGR